jgi:hypothetical protein
MTNSVAVTMTGTTITIADKGAQGLKGADGNTLLYGVGAPAAGLGANGNFYIDTAAKVFYGPKAAGAWPAGVSMVGVPGTPGVGVLAGGTIGQVLIKRSNADFDTVWGDAAQGAVDGGAAGTIYLGIQNIDCGGA